MKVVDTTNQIMYIAEAPQETLCMEGGEGEGGEGGGGGREERRGEGRGGGGREEEEVKEGMGRETGRAV